MGRTIQLPVPTLNEVTGDVERKLSSFDVPCESEEVSDGFHTFGELYRHRDALFCALASFASQSTYTWKSKTHWIDGELQPVWEGYFVAGVELRLKSGPKMITYHMPLDMWDSFDGIAREQAPPHDGHMAEDVLQRLADFTLWR